MDSQKLKSDLIKQNVSTIYFTPFPKGLDALEEKNTIILRLFVNQLSFFLMTAQYVPDSI